MASDSCNVKWNHAQICFDSSTRVHVQQLEALVVAHVFLGDPDQLLVLGPTQEHVAISAPTGEVMSHPIGPRLARGWRVVEDVALGNIAIKPADPSWRSSVLETLWMIAPATSCNRRCKFPGHR